MGIPVYFKTIVESNPDIIYKLEDNNQDIDNFYLDSNTFVYEAIVEIEKESVINKIFIPIEDRIISRTIKNIEAKIELINPKLRVIIGFDGVAPRAKLEQQRTRRYKSIYEHRLMRDIGANISKLWDTIAITPGTAFMKKLDKAIYSHFKKPIAKFKHLLISCSDEPGEGEHKLFEFIRSVSHLGQTTSIYGMDADLIMLCLKHAHLCGRIVLYRETPVFIASIDASLDPDTKYLMDMTKFAQDLTARLTDTIPEQPYICPARISDYVFLCFMLGNDFLPHFPAINIRTGGVNKLMDAYQQYVGCTPDMLTDGENINYPIYRKLLAGLAENEEQFMIEETKIRNKWAYWADKLPNSTPDECKLRLNSLPLIDRSIELTVDPSTPGWRERYYRNLMGCEPTDERVKQIVMRFYEGLEWTQSYYTNGCKDWEWFYPYKYPPLVDDALRFGPMFSVTLLSKKEKKPVHELVQLCYVIPKSVLRDMLDRSMYNKLMEELGDGYEENCQFSWAYCKYFWECHVNFPHLSVKDIETLCKKNNFI